MPKNVQFRQSAANKDFSLPSKNPEGISNGLLFSLFLLLVVAVITWWHFSSQTAQQASEEHITPIPTTSVLDSLSPNIADLNQDGKVDASDAAQLRDSFYKTDSNSLQADLNQDDKVDVSDYSLFVSLQERTQLDSSTESAQ